MMKDHEIVTLGISPRPLLLAISLNPVRFYKYFTKLNRSLSSLPLSGTLNFSLWIAEVLALDPGRIVGTYKMFNPKLLL